MESQGEAENVVPVIDLSPFFQHHHSNPSVVRSRESVIEQIAEASQEWGFFQVINHGICVDVMEEALAASRMFFDSPLEKKVKVKPNLGTSPIPTGYVVSAPQQQDQYEYLYFGLGDSAVCDVMPQDPPHFRNVVERLLELGSTSSFIASLVIEPLGLSENLVRENLTEKNGGLIMIHNLPPNLPPNGHMVGHQDQGYLAIAAQDETGGYQVLRNGEWVDIVPTKGALVVNIGDKLQVVGVCVFEFGLILEVVSDGFNKRRVGFVWQEMSKNRLRSAVHRVVPNAERDRCIFAYVYL